MKRYLILLAGVFSFSICSAQFATPRQVHKWTKYIIPADKEVYYEVKVDTTIPAGTSISSKVGDATVTEVLTAPKTIKKKGKVKVKHTKNWKATTIEHKDGEPGKLVLNPWTYYDPNGKATLYSDGKTNLNRKCYIKIDANERLTIRKHYYNVSAVTIPFIVRLGLNDSISSRVSADINAGVAMSYNIDWVTYRNRRIKATSGNNGISFGFTLGFTRIALNKSTTSLATEPVTEDEAGLGLLLAPGIGMNFRGIRMVAHVGWEFGLTSNATSKWNYDKKLLFGLGLGVNILTLGKLAGS